MIQTLLLVLLLITVGYFGNRAIQQWRNRLPRRLRRRFKKMRRLILVGIDDTEQEQAEKLLDDCENFLNMTLMAHERLQELRAMESDATLLTGGETDTEAHVEALEQRVHESMEDFLSRLYRISSEVTFDWKRSLRQLEEFTQDLETRREVLLDLESEVSTTTRG